MVHIGDKIRQLREEKKISRPEFCGDEEELTIRQLVRIENGDSNPTIIKIQYIADRLGIPSYQLMVDYEELPARYKELKYLLLRQPVYADASVLEQKEKELDEIFESFYDDLSEEEQKFVDYQQATIELLSNGQVEFITPIIEETIEEFSKKEYYQVNDLVFLKLLPFYFLDCLSNEVEIPERYIEVFEASFSKLLQEEDFFDLDNLFNYGNCIFACLSYYNRIGDYSKFQDSVAILKNVYSKIQDFQKQPLVTMLEWKVLIFQEKDLAQATIKYQEAKNLAQLLHLETVVDGLDFEWKADLEKFSNR